jgi:predicted Fe-Mo cluster-binding NifX family protein
MNVCIPIKKDKGLQSNICEHFGSAPAFLLVDTSTRDVKPLVNRNQHHEHGQCRPLQALAGETVDAIIVGGIGRGAYTGLTRAGIQVLLSTQRTVEEALDALAAGELRAMDASGLCGGHAQGMHGHGQPGGRPGHGCGGPHGSGRRGAQGPSETS